MSVIGVAGTACSSSGGKTTTAPAVAEVTENFARPGDRPLPTLVLYPTDRSHAPYPLIVFAHGFGSDGAEYRGLLMHWAAAGYVVAAPSFPRTHAGAPGGPDAGDYVNQPADVGAVVTAMLAAKGPLAGLIDADNIGAAGHSLGGVTTLGLVANTCCRDARIKAAVVMAGDPLTFPTGKVDYTGAPPIMFVHGTDDDLVTYEASVDAFNLAHGPKALVTIDGGDHGSPVKSSGKAFASVARATTDFFNVFLKGDTAASSAIEADGENGVTRVVFDAQAGSQMTVPTTPHSAARALHASVTPNTGLTNGQSVTVEWAGYTPGKTINIVQCSGNTPGDSAACDLKHGAILHPDPTGKGSVAITIVTGTVGTGICDAAHNKCQVVVNDGGSLDPAASIRLPISFASR